MAGRSLKYDKKARKFNHSYCLQDLRQISLVDVFSLQIGEIIKLREFHL